MNRGSVTLVLTRATISLVIVAVVIAQGARTIAFAVHRVPKDWPLGSKILLTAVTGVAAVIATYALLDFAVSLVMRKRQALTKWLASNYTDLEALVSRYQGRKPKSRNKY